MGPQLEAVYRYREPVFLPRGTVISMRFHFDNSAANPRNPNHPPKRVRAGNRTVDEMGHLWLQVLPRGPGDQRLRLQEAVMQHWITKYPEDYGAHLQLGSVMLARMNPTGAMSALLEAVRLDPSKAEAHNLLGSAYAATGRVADAITQFRLALERRPEYPNASFNLGNALMRATKYDEAIEQFNKVLAALPDDPLAKDRLEKAIAARDAHATLKK